MSGDTRGAVIIIDEGIEAFAGFVDMAERGGFEPPIPVLPG
jgi:hypothetical protein